MAERPPESPSERAATRWTPSGLIGVVHVRAMPGDPAYEGGGFDAAIEAARADASALAGCDAIVVENFGSAPFPKGTPESPTPPHQVAALTRAALACRGAFDGPVGINVLRNDARAALSIAAAVGAAFIRVNVHVGAYVTDQGLIEGRAHETLRLRASLGAEAVAILADVRVKHAAPLAPVPLAQEVADVLKRGMADAIVVSGTGTGAPVDRTQLADVRAAAGGAPVVLGSGVTESSAPALARVSDAAIVGTWIKQGGDVSAPVDPARVARMRAAWHGGG